MGKYSVYIKPSAVKEIEAIHLKKVRQKIARRIRQLAQDPRPHGCQKLSGLARYRLRQGAYRIVYEVDDDKQLVYVVKKDV